MSEAYTYEREVYETRVAVRSDLHQDCIRPTSLQLLRECVRRVAHVMD